MVDKKKVLICGAGSIGIYLGAKLNSKGHEIKLFGRRKLREVNTREVIIENEKFEVPEKIFRLPKNEKNDFVFITSKLYDLDNLITLIKKNNIKGKIIVGIQNGLVDTSKYSKILGKKIIPIVVFSGFNIKDNIIQVSPTPTGWVTEYSKDGKKIGELLLNAGIPCRANKNFNSLRAEKTIINCCLNALSAIENKTFAELFSGKKTKERINNLFDECYSILEKEYNLDEREEMRRKIFEHWKNLKHYSSTCQDVHSGRKNEARFFNGYMIGVAKKYELSTTHNKEILKDIKTIER